MKHHVSQQIVGTNSTAAKQAVHSKSQYTQVNYRPLWTWCWDFGGTHRVKKAQIEATIPPHCAWHPCKVDDNPVRSNLICAHSAVSGRGVNLNKTSPSQIRACHVVVLSRFINTSRAFYSTGFIRASICCNHKDSGCKYPGSSSTNSRIVC